MEFKVLSGTLYKHLANAARLISGKPSFHILDCFLLKLEGDTLSIMGSDLENSVLTTFQPDQVMSEGVIAAPRLLLETLKNYGNTPMHFKLDEENLVLHVTHGEDDVAGGEFHFTCQSADEYPSMPELEEGEITKIESTNGALLKGIQKTLFSASTDTNSMPHICGILIEVKEKHLRFVSTNANRIACYTRTDKEYEGDHAVLLKNKPAQLLQSILPADDEPLVIEFDSRNLQITTTSYRLTCRLSEGEFPDYERVIPKDYPDSLTVDRDAFLNALKQVAPFSNRWQNLVQFSLKAEEGYIKISAKNSESGEAYQNIPAQYEGENRDVYFNTQLISDSLPVMSASDVIMTFHPTAKNSEIRPATNESETEDLFMVVVHSRNDYDAY